MAKAPEVWGVVEDAIHGKLTVDEALAKIASLESAGATADTAADAAAQAALDAKYPTGGAQ